MLRSGQLLATALVSRFVQLSSHHSLTVASSRRWRFHLFRCIGHQLGSCASCSSSRIRARLADAALMQRPQLWTTSTAMAVWPQHRTLLLINTPTCRDITVLVHLICCCKHVMPQHVCVCVCACCLCLLHVSAAKVCTGTPPAASNATAWNTTARAGKLMGGNCSAACLPTATGAGYVATCTGDGTWNVTGSCAGDRPSAVAVFGLSGGCACLRCHSTSHCPGCAKI